jgi:hypothetical protein
MTGLKIKFDDKVYAFSSDMKVTYNDQSVGTWTATVPAGAENRNGISFVLNSGQKHFVPVTYAFNGNNQLTLIVADTDGGISQAAVAYNGAIDIDDNDDAIYRFLDIDSQPSKTYFITVYGKLSLAPGATHILIDLKEGGSTKIKSAPLLDRVLTGRNVDKQPGDDFVSFRAATRNLLDTGKTVVTNANITFTGKWDIQEGKLTFLSQIEGTGEDVKAALVFKGTFGPVTMGFQFTNADGDPKLSFVVKGDHRWSEGDAAWNLSLGYSKQEFIAEAGTNLNIVPGEGQTLKISGDLKIVKRLGSDGAKKDILPTDVKMNLNIAYRLDQPGRCIIFEADLSKTSLGGNYNLFLAGTFQVRGGQLFFAVKFSNSSGAPEVTAELKFSTNIGGVDAAIDLLVSDKGGRPSINFNISLTFVDGVPVRSNPIQLP